VACRQLRRAAADPRYGFGESILTVWPSPPSNFAGTNDCVRALHVDDNGDGIGDRTVTIAMPILHFLGLLARMGPEFRVLPEQTVGGHVVSGFASQDGSKVRVLLYSHNAADTESRSDAQFDVSLRLAGLEAGKVTVEEYRFDQDHNSYFRRGRELREQPVSKSPPDKAQTQRVEEALRDLESDKPATQSAGLDKLVELGPAAASALGPIYQLYQKSEDAGVREKAEKAVKRIMAPRACPAAVVKEIEDLSKLRRTGVSTQDVPANGSLTVPVRIAGNGACFLVLEPAKAR
jgi:hypothetical protein